MQIKFHNTTNGIFISLETDEAVLSLKRPYQSQKGAERALAKAFGKLVHTILEVDLPKEVRKI